MGPKLCCHKWLVDMNHSLLGTLDGSLGKVAQDTQLLGQNELKAGITTEVELSRPRR